MNEKNNNQEKDSQHETLFKEKNESRDKFIRNRSGENRAAIKKTYLQSELLETKRVTKVTKGGRRFSFATLTLLKDESQKKVSFSYRGSKDMVGSLRKSFQEGRKKLINY
jgi:small subunit ribosomal protein S5